MNDNVETTVRMGKRSGMAQFGVVDPNEVPNHRESAGGLRGETVRCVSRGCKLRKSIWFESSVGLMIISLRQQ